MKRNHSNNGTITGIAEATAERVRLSGEVLQALARAIAENEKVQRKFRTAVLLTLSRIEATANLMSVSQMGEVRHNKPFFEQKLKDDAEAAEHFISEQSERIGLKMIRYIYGDTELPVSKPNKRRKWSECPSYEI